MSMALAEKYDLRVPRYTSYPTAPHFSAAVDGETYRSWLGVLDPAAALSLYLHVPFCDSMCWFCGCYTKVVGRYQPVAAYLETLYAEVDLVADALPDRFTIRHLHWGGGSPTIVAADDWPSMTDAIRRRFDVAADAEVAVELDPRDATEGSVAALVQAGVNRASIGVQDFDADVQAAINRHQPYDVVERVCGWLRGAGIEAINLDLMYGLPHQTVDKVVAMVDRAVSLKPSRVALFGYAHVPWMKSHQKMIDEAALPGVQARWQQADAAAERLVGHGYVSVGLDHFARPDDTLAAAAGSGRLRRNFQGYTTDAAPVLLGLGASAIGALPQGYVQNAAPLRGYADAIAAGHPATARGVTLTADDRLRRTVIEHLMCDLTVDLSAVRTEVDVNADFSDELERLAPLADDGIVATDGNRITVMEAGRPFVRLVAAAFDAYLERGPDPGTARHSRAV